jgi:hypothetical protein
MALYFARWKDGSFSLVEADNEDEAYELLDEFGDEPVALSELDSCLIDFELTDRGAFRLRGFGEVMDDEIFERGYPLLREALRRASEEDEYDPEQENARVEEGHIPPDVAKAVRSERDRFAEFRPAPASTELGTDMQARTNVSGRNADAIISREAAEILAKLPDDKDKQPN